MSMSTVKWSYKNGSWIDFAEEDNAWIEEEYKDYIDGFRAVNRTLTIDSHHLIIDYAQMNLRCRRMCHRDRLTYPHLIFEVKREEFTE